MERATTRRRGRPPGAPPASQRRLELLEAAARVIAREGPAVSMEAIAAEAGVTKPVLYTHFDGKAGLAEAVADHVADGILRDVQSEVDLSTDIERQVRDALSAFVRWVDREPELFEFLVHPPTGRDPGTEVLDLVDRIAAGITSPIRLALETAGGSGDDATVYARAVVGAAYVATERWTREAGDGARDPSALIDQLTAFVAGALTRPRPG